MYIHVSEEQRFSPTGFVADWCPVCRACAVFAYGRREYQSRVWGIAIMKWHTTRECAKCGDCGCELSAATSDYPMISADRSGLADLVERTNPDLRDVVGGSRAAVLGCVLRNVARMTPQPRWEEKVAAVGGWILALTGTAFVAVIATAVYLDAHAGALHLSKREMNQILDFLTIGGVALGVGTGVMGYRWRSGRVRRRLIMTAREVIRSLDATPIEIEGSLQMARSAGNPIAARLRIEELAAERSAAA